MGAPIPVNGFHRHPSLSLTASPPTPTLTKNSDANGGTPMGFKLVICPPNYQDEWPDKLREAIPDIDVHLCPTVGEAMEVIGDADAAFGDIVPE